MIFSTSPIKLLKKIRVVTIAVSVLGILLSGYSIYVHQRKEANKDYKAFCDINEEVSCSKVFTSSWGKGFGILGTLLGGDSPVVLANGFYGIAFYLFVIALGEIQSVTAANIQKYGVLLTNLLSVYLGYILLFVLKTKCVICFTIYGINFLIAIMCFVRVHYVAGLKSKKKGSKNQNAKQTTGKKNQQNANKINDQSANKSNQQNADKNNQISKKKEKKQKQNAEPVVNHQNAVSSKKKPEQLQNAQNNIKNRQNQNPSKKNQQNAVHQNASNKQSSNKNANPNKHSKKKNN